MVRGELGTALGLRPALTLTGLEHILRMEIAGITEPGLPGTVGFFLTSWQDLEAYGCTLRDQHNAGL